MPEFQSMFEKSAGKPIEYEGKNLVMVELFPTEGRTKFRLVMEMCNGNPVQEDSASAWTADRGPQHRTGKGFFRTSEDGLAPWRDLEPPGYWRQAVSVRLICKDRNGCHFIIEGKTVNGRKGIVFWQSTEWNTVEFEVVGQATAIEVYNAWDCGNGVIESWHNGAAMIVEELPNGRRYRCNDGFADDDFDDVVFRLERIC